jgi:hypothetical protein
MEPMEDRLWKVLRWGGGWICAAVVAVYVAAMITIIQDELIGVRPEELTRAVYSRLVDGGSREAPEVESALDSMKGPNEAPYPPGDLWDNPMPSDDLLDWDKLFQELTYIVAAVHSDLSTDCESASARSRCRWTS